MSKPQDGLVSRLLNRPISRFITRFALKLPIRPTTWTMSIFVLPVLACVFLVRGDYTSVVIGAAIMQVFSILDGCDGEIARAKSLESKFGERLDSFCDFVAEVLFLVGLGLGLHRFREGIICAAIIAAGELLLLMKSKAPKSDSDLSQSVYPRYRGMIEHSGLSNFEEKFIWWTFQLTKRDVAVLGFLFLALLGMADWILHIRLAVASVSLVLIGIAAIRSGIRHRVVIAPRS